MAPPLVPAFLTIDGVNFPLEANELSVGIALGIDELQALRYSIDQIVNGDAREMSLKDLSRDGFHVQELSLMPVDPTRPPGWYGDGPINWLRLSGRRPDLSNAFLAWSGFARHALVIPRPVVLELVSQLRVIREQILSGKREGRIDDTLVPPLPPLTPELEEHERLRGLSFDDAQEYREELYAHWK
jgi:hypothetical protein